MAGVGDLVAALTGGSAIEQAAYDKATLRMLDAQAKQIDMDKKVQEAYALSRKNSGREAFGNLFATIGPELQGQNYQLTPEQMSSFYQYGTQGDISDIENVIKGFQQQAMRNRLLEGSLGEGMTDPNAVARAFFTANPMVETVQKQGDLLIRGNYGANPVIDALMTKENAIAGASADKSGAGGVREAKIQDAMRQFGFDRGTAVKYVDGYIDVKPNPVTGKLEFTDAINVQGQRIPYTGPGANVPFPAAPEGESLSENVGAATGPISAIGAVAAKVQSILNLPVSERQKEFVRTRQQFRASTNQLVKAFVENPRMPVAEQQWVRQEIDLLPKVFDTPEIMIERMKSLYDNLNRRIARYDVIINDPNAPADIVNNYTEAKINLQMFLSEMGDPYRDYSKPSAKAHPALQGQ